MLSFAQHLLSMGGGLSHALYFRFFILRSVIAVSVVTVVNAFKLLYVPYGAEWGQALSSEGRPHSVRIP